MFGYADVEKLRGACAPRAAVLSLYLAVPLDPAGIRGLAAGAVPAAGAGRSHGAAVHPAAARGGAALPGLAGRDRRP